MERQNKKLKSQMEELKERLEKLSNHNSLQTSNEITKLQNELEKQKHEVSDLRHSNSKLKVKLIFRQFVELFFTKNCQTTTHCKLQMRSPSCRTNLRSRNMRFLI